MKNEKECVTLQVQQSLQSGKESVAVPHTCTERPRKQCPEAAEIVCPESLLQSESRATVPGKQSLFGSLRFLTQYWNSMEFDGIRSVLLRLELGALPSERSCSNSPLLVVLFSWESGPTLLARSFKARLWHEHIALTSFQKGFERL